MTITIIIFFIIIVIITFFKLCTSNKHYATSIKDRRIPIVDRRNVKRNIYQ